MSSPKSNLNLYVFLQKKIDFMRHNGKITPNDSCLLPCYCGCWLSIRPTHLWVWRSVICLF